MTRRIEYAGLPIFLPDNPPHLHIDKFTLYIEGTFSYSEESNTFREFIRSLGSIRNGIFTTKGRNHKGYPYFLIPKNRFLFDSSKIDYGAIGRRHCVLRFPLICNLTRFIAHHPNGVARGQPLENVLRHPSKFHNSTIPARQRMNRWFQYMSAQQACLDMEDNILSGTLYMRCDNVAERFCDYVAFILAFIREYINTHIRNSEKPITFEWNTQTLLFRQLEAYHDYQCPNALALVRALRHDLEHLSSVVDTKHYTTKRKIDSFSITVPLREATKLQCTFYAKTSHRIRIELRYLENLRQLINRLPDPAVGMPVFINRVLNHAFDQLDIIYIPLRLLLGENRVRVTTSLALRYTRFFYALDAAAGGKKDIMRQLLTFLLENGSITDIPRNDRYTAPLFKAKILEEASIRPGNKKKTFIPRREYRVLIERLRTADPSGHKGIGNILRRYSS